MKYRLLYALTLLCMISASNCTDLYDIGYDSNSDDETPSEQNKFIDKKYNNIKKFLRTKTNYYRKQHNHKKAACTQKSLKQKKHRLLFKIAKR